MALTGERFVLNLSDDDSDTPSEQDQSISKNTSPLLIKDVLEHSQTTAPVAPRLKSSTGFPEHRKRSVPSRFKQRRGDNVLSAGASATDTSDPRHPVNSLQGTDLSQNRPQAPTFEEKQKQEIDSENKQRIAEMSPEDIQREQAELMSGLPPSLIERFLRRANIDHTAENDDGSTTDIPDTSSGPSDPASIPPKSVSFDIPADASDSNPSDATSSRTQPFRSHPRSRGSDSIPPDKHIPNLRLASQPPAPTPIHFPPPPTSSPSVGTQTQDRSRQHNQHPKSPPDLDPTSDTFTDDLHAHYFPQLPKDESSLTWLRPVTPSESASSPYNPSLTALPPSSLRFDFTGDLLAPRTSLTVPVTKGLHHHASAPESAGYTVPEISTLSRSTVPAQRCIAWQILGRLLFRLGKGQFGGKGHELAEGIWAVVERERILEGMMAEAARGRHVSAQAWAVEGCWLWRMGGGERGMGEGTKAQ